MKIIFIVVVISALSFSTFQHLTQVQYFDKGDGFYSTNDDTTTVKKEYMPKWVQTPPVGRPNKKVEIKDAALYNVKVISNKTTFTTVSRKEAFVMVNTVYFPGWHVMIDGKSTQISYNNPRGLIAFNVPAGKHNIEVAWGETPLRLISDLVSLLSLIILTFTTMKRRWVKV